MIAEILSIGNELTIGQAIDTNCAWLSQQLAVRGVVCARHVTVSDDRAAIAAAFREAAGRSELLLVTGGLGPTPDDLTREALADALGVELMLREENLRQIEEYFQARRRPMHAANRNQAMCPCGAIPIENTTGTAPGIRARIGQMDVFVMPGVPREMKVMFERSVAPCLPGLEGATIAQRTLKSFGMSESEVGERIGDLMARGRNPTVGTSAADLIISIRIHAHGQNAVDAHSLAETDVRTVRQRLSDTVFGEETDELQDATARLLIQHGKTISTAESCTGGLIAKRLTDAAGSSAYLMQGLVTYSNESKTRLLEVPAELIHRRGAVSADVAEALACNCRRIAGTDLAVSATGIAGPSGATPGKPIGLVYLGLADASRVVVKEVRLGETLLRHEIRDRAAKAALNLIRLSLLDSRL